MLNIRDLCKTGENLQLNHINLTVPAGAITGLVCSMDVSNLLVRLLIGMERPAKGEILLDGEPVLWKQGTNTSPHIGLVMLEEGLYDRMTVTSYLKFFSKLLNSTESEVDIMMKLGLRDIAEKKIAKLTHSQKRRLSLARESLKNLTLLIFQEPILNMDKYDARLVNAFLEELVQKQVAVLTTSHSYKDALLLGGRVFAVDEEGIREMENNEATEESLRAAAEGEDPPVFKIEKIPAKIEDRILLFNPIEIDYIESEGGVSYLNVRGERFACSFTLKELEGRLQQFGFFKCHRSYLVNLQKVKEIITWSRNSYGLILEDKKNSTIPLSKNRIEEMKGLLNL